MRKGKRRESDGGEGRREMGGRMEEEGRRERRGGMEGEGRKDGWGGKEGEGRRWRRRRRRRKMAVNNSLTEGNDPIYRFPSRQESRFLMTSL